jgi:hypothetical protein
VLYGLALRHQFTACSSRLCTLLLTPPFLLKIEPSKRPSRPNFNSRAGFCENSMSSEVVQADQMDAPQKSSLGIVGTLRRRNCPLIGFGNFAVRAERPSRSRIWPQPRKRFPVSPNESRSRLISPSAARVMHAVQVGACFGSSRSGRVKWCHEKRCLVTIARAHSAPRKSGPGQRAEKSMTKGCGERECGAPGC